MDTIINYLTDPSHIFGTLFGGISGLIIFIAIVAIITEYLNNVSKRNNYARAIPASARVVKVSRSIGNGTYGGLIVNITLDVIPTDAAPYQVKNVWCLEPLALSKVKEGDSLSIRIDSKHPKEVFSAETWAWNIGQIPLRFGNRIPIFYINR